MTKYIREEDIDDNVVRELADALKQGQILVLKTDTVYGMVANALDEAACRRIYEVKGRPAHKPLIVLISDIAQLEMITESVSSAERRLVKAFWPGALTIRFKRKKDVLPDIVSAGDEFARVRLLGRGWIISEILKVAGVPAVAPSANLSGSPTGVKMENIVKELDGKVDYIIDSGDVDDNTTSTVVDVRDGEITILREGKITSEQIRLHMRRYGASGYSV